MEQTGTGSASGIAISPAAARPRDGVAAAGAGERLLWLDRAKGIGILLVVMGHAAGGLIDFQAIAPTPWLMRLFFAIYTFHMPLFFFLSALLVDRRVRRDGAGFARAMLRRLVYPYFLWSVIQLTIIFLAATLVNTPLDAYWRNVAAIPYAPVSQFWFLYALAILQVVSLLLLPILSRALFLGVMIAFWLAGWVVPMPLPLGQAAQYALYFGLGVACGPQVGALVARLRGWPGVAIAALFLLALLVAAELKLAPVLHGVVAGARPNAAAVASVAWRIDIAPVALLGALTVFILASSATHAPGRALGALGRASMTIYLTHVILIAGSRILIARAAGPIDPLALLPILTAIGIGGPFAVREIARRLGVARLLALD